MVSATQAAVEGYAKSIVRSATELIVAVGEDGAVRMSTARGEPGRGTSRRRWRRWRRGSSTDLVTVSMGGKARVAKGFWFEPFQWYLLVSEERSAFYDQVNQIAVRTVIILVGAIVGGVVLVLIFASYLTRPLTRVVGTMKEIISTNDLSQAGGGGVPRRDRRAGPDLQPHGRRAGEGVQRDQGIRAEGGRCPHAGEEDQGHLPAVRARRKSSTRS